MHFDENVSYLKIKMDLKMTSLTLQETIHYIIIRKLSKGFHFN